MTADTEIIHVMAAVVVNPGGEVLIARRHAQAHQGNLWEFPGGKREAGETPTQALARELGEELGIAPTRFRPLIRVRHDYVDKHVLLDVWRVDAWVGTPHGREGQPLRWVTPEALPRYAFPEANLPIVTASRLPPHYVISAEPTADLDAWLADLTRVLDAGQRLIQLRVKSLDHTPYRQLATRAIGLCRDRGARLLINADPDLAMALGADGVHLSSVQLGSLTERPLPADRWVAASCHSAEELARAERIGADFALLSPVLATASHPDAVPLGWDRLRELTDTVSLPVYALGGMHPDHCEQAWSCGAQGIAAIRGLWGAS